MSTNIAANPYLSFDKSCPEAMAFYQSVFGEAPRQQTYGGADANCPEAKKSRIMYTCLSGRLRLLLAGEDPGNHQADNRKTRETLASGGTDQSRMLKIRTSLTADKRASVPLTQQTSVGICGDLIDRCKMHWMVNIKQPLQNDK